MIWLLTVFLALSLTYGSYKTLKSKKTVMKATVYQGVFLWMLVIFLLLIPSINKLNLLWIVPISFPLISIIIFNMSSGNERQQI